MKLLLGVIIGVVCFTIIIVGVDLVRIAGIMGREKDNHSMVVILI